MRILIRIGILIRIRNGETRIRIETRTGNETRVRNSTRTGNAETSIGNAETRIRNAETRMGQISGRLFEGSKDREGSGCRYLEWRAVSPTSLCSCEASSRSLGGHAQWLSRSRWLMVPGESGSRERLRLPGHGRPGKGQPEHELSSWSRRLHELCRGDMRIIHNRGAPIRLWLLPLPDSRGTMTHHHVKHH